MPTVVTPENMIDVINHKPIPEFKAPEAAAADTGAADGGDKKAAPPKDVNTGKFVSPTGEKTADDTSGEPAEKTEGEARADAGASAGDDDVDEKDLPERVRKTIGKKHRAMREAEELAESQYNRARAAEQRADDLARENAELKAKGKPAAETAVDDDEPKAANFKTVGEYTDALVTYRVNKALAERDSRAQQATVEQSVARVKAEFGERVAKAAEAIPDYHEVVGAADVDVPSHVAQHIVASPVGPELGYHLAKHPAELDRIKKLSPIRAIAELGKLEDKLAKPAPAAKTNGGEPAPASGASKQVSKAPAPIDPLNTTGSTPVEKDPAKMSFKELRAYEAERSRKARAQR